MQDYAALDGEALMAIADPRDWAFTVLNKAIGGTDQGLSIVKTIVELHGGSVGCDSIQGHGSYFWARLPVSGVPGNAPQRPKRRRRPDLK